jgi:hypothetical protein
MTNQIDPVQPPGGSASPSPAARAISPISGDFSAELVRAQAGRPAQSGPALEDGPPAEVHAAMASASRAFDSLAASGRELQFNETHGGRVEVALHGVSGERIAVLQLSDLYALLQQEGSR